MFAWRRKQSRREVNGFQGDACVKVRPHRGQQELSKQWQLSCISSSLCQGRAGQFLVRLPHSDVPIRR